LTAKLIGVAAHYARLLIRVSSGSATTTRPTDLVRKGRDIERRVLALAMRYHHDDRVILNGPQYHGVTGTRGRRGGELFIDLPQ
jgi:formyltetrahydrofolate hydrolase